MKVGLCTYNIAASELVELAKAADETGFDSLWLGEHVVLPLDYASEHPTTGTTTAQHHTGPIVDPSTILVDPFVALSACAAVTTRLKLATAIYILPLRHPLISARMVATLHDVSQGRFLLGVGSGWLVEEFDALGVEFGSRRARYDESIDILRAAFRGEPFEQSGEQFQFGPVQICPKPIAVPLILGGNSEPALRRAAIKADGWFASGTPSFEEAVRLRDRVETLHSESGRTTPFSVHVRVPRGANRDLERYAAAGFANVVLWADEFWATDRPVSESRAALADRAAQLGMT